MTQDYERPRTMDERIYTELKTVVCVALGGALAGAYCFWKTFKAIGKPKQARNAAIIMVALFVVTMGALFIPLFDKVPNVVFWGLQIGITYGIYRGQVASDVENDIEGGSKPVFGWGNTIAVGLLAAIITLAPLLGLMYARPDFFVSMAAKQYGKAHNEITYDARNVTETEIDKIASALTSVGFFDEVAGKAAYVEKTGTRYHIVIACTEEVRDSPEIIEANKELRDLIQRYFPANRIVLELALETPDNVFARLE